MRIISSGISDVGRKRDRNEDAFLINEELQLYVVADGMGGHVGGEYASALAVNTVEEVVSAMEFPDTYKVGDVDPAEVIRGRVAGAVSAAGQKIHAWAEEHQEYRGMGTTAVALLIHGTNAFIAHVGDSRLYSVRDGAIEQITEDHSLVAQSIREGLLTAEQAKRHRMRNVITRALGFEEDVEVDVQIRALRRGDRFLICSDGLSGKVEDNEMRDLVCRYDVQEACRQLVGLACARGGEDNITVVLVEIEEAR